MSFKVQEEPVALSELANFCTLQGCCCAEVTVVLSSANLSIFADVGDAEDSDMLGYDAEPPKSMFPFAKTAGDMYRFGKAGAASRRAAEFITFLLVLSKTHSVYQRWQAQASTGTKPLQQQMWTIRK